MHCSLAAEWTKVNTEAVSATAPRVVTAMPSHTVPAHLTTAEMVALVSELYVEGTLSWDQLSSLGRLPELEGLLGEALAKMPAGRRMRVSVP